jgi:hypothetical protein
MRKIKLSSLANHGLYALVDDEDFDEVSKYTWNPNPKGYAIRTTRDGGQKKTIYLHRMIADLMGIGSAQQIDHIDGDKLDNRRCNLRQATNQSNQANVGIQANNSTGFKGVTMRTKGNGRPRYIARIGVGYKRIQLGSFNTPEDAHAAYLEAAVRFFGEFAKS